jgi:hypothetical protein
VALSTAGGECAYQLPLNAASQFPGLFTALDAQQGSLELVVFVIFLIHHRQPPLHHRQQHPNKATQNHRRH